MKKIFENIITVDKALTIPYNKSTKKRTVLSTEVRCYMIATKQMDIRANLKKYFDLAFSGEPIIVSRKGNKNVVVISETEYNDLQKAKRNAEYLAKLDKSAEQYQKGETISFSLEELKAMEDDGWKPTQKIKEFMGAEANE